MASPAGRFTDARTVAARAPGLSRHRVHRPRLGRTFGPAGGMAPRGGAVADEVTGPFLPGTREGRRTLVVPRVVGLAPPDARFLLSGLQLRISMHVIGPARGLPRVVSQSPAPDTPIPSNRLVRANIAG